MSVLAGPQTLTTIPKFVDDFPRHVFHQRLTSRSQSQPTVSLSALATRSELLYTQQTSPPSTPVYRLSLRATVLFILPFLSLLGGYGTWCLGSYNGTFNAIVALIASKDPKFPGSAELLVRTYTDVQWLDRHLSILVTFFAPVVDRDQGALTIFSVMGFGQFGAVWTLMVMESLRMGNRWRAVSLYVLTLPSKLHLKESLWILQSDCLKSVLPQ